MEIEVSCVESRVQTSHLNFMNTVPRDPTVVPVSILCIENGTLGKRTLKKRTAMIYSHMSILQKREFSQSIRCIIVMKAGKGCNGRQYTPVLGF